MLARMARLRLRAPVDEAESRLMFDAVHESGSGEIDLRQEQLSLEAEGVCGVGLDGERVGHQLREADARVGDAHADRGVRSRQRQRGARDIEGEDVGADGQLPALHVPYARGGQDECGGAEWRRVGAAGVEARA
eukprot:5444249-Pleurochrysis_carterae.AAC.2